MICYQNLSSGLGGTFFVQGSSPTLADLLQSIPDHSYTEGESIFADLAMILVSQYFSINQIEISLHKVQTEIRLIPFLFVIYHFGCAAVPGN